MIGAIEGGWHGGGGSSLLGYDWGTKNCYFMSGTDSTNLKELVAHEVQSLPDLANSTVWFWCFGVRMDVTINKVL